MGKTPSHKSTSPTQLQARDYDLLLGLFVCRMMTLSHIAALYFSGKVPAATKRIQLLKASGFLTDRRRRIGDVSVLSLTKKAYETLTAAAQLDSFPRLSAQKFAKRSQIQETTIRHELAVVDVKVALTTALIAKEAHRIVEFTTWPLLAQFAAIHPTERQRVTVWPDGFLHIREIDEDGAISDYRFFLELDRSTEVQRILADKALCYRDYYTSGGFAERCGGTREAFRDHPFRVLMVLRNAERRNNTAERLMNCTPPVKFQAWLATFDELINNPLGKIWICPRDYATATEGTAYAPDRRRDLTVYVRRPDRERLVEERIAKYTLFEDAA